MQKLCQEGLVVVFLLYSYCCMESHALPMTIHTIIQPTPESASATLQNNATLVDHKSCATWMYRRTNDTCECGDNINSAVKCDGQHNEAFILDCYCMTHDEQHGAVVGKCFYKCAQSHNELDLIYHPLPSDPSQLNEQQCGYLNRDGRLCGRCKEGYSPLAYSYDLQCMNCTEGNYNWAKFVTAAFVPLTLFYFFVVLFQFRANSPQLYGFFIVVQAVSMPAHLRILLSYADMKSYPEIGVAVRVLATMYGIWNLDFFRTLYSNICLDISPLQNLALDYAIAFYPLFLIILTVILIELHSRGFKVIVWLWKPFQKCLTFLKDQWHVKMSMIDVIATFLLLSYTRLLNVSTDLLFYTTVYNINGTEVGKYLYYDATIEYFGKEHLPYAISAIFIIATFILSPIVLLLLYPMRLFQRFLDYTKLRNRVLETFIDAFQGCYKDGTKNGERDYRYFSALTFIVRMLFFVIYGFTLNEMYYGIGTIALLAMGILYATFQPYKTKFAIYNIVEVSMFLLLAMMHAAVLCINMALIKAPQMKKFVLWICFTLAAAPLVYITVITLNWVFTKSRLGKGCTTSLKMTRRDSVECEHSSDEELPDRMMNPEQYLNCSVRPLLLTQSDNGNRSNREALVNYGTMYSRSQ